MKRERNLFFILMAMILVIGVFLPISQVSATTTYATATMDPAFTRGNETGYWITQSDCYISW